MKPLQRGFNNEQVKILLFTFVCKLENEIKCCVGLQKSFHLSLLCLSFVAIVINMLLVQNSGLFLRPWERYFRHFFQLGGFGKQC